MANFRVLAGAGSSLLTALLQERFFLGWSRAPSNVDFDTVPPKSVGLDGDKLDALRDSLMRRKTHAFLVLRNDAIAYEWYGLGFGSGRRHGVASLAKALAGGMALLVALSDGRIRPDDPAAKYIPAWQDHPQKSRITIRQLATHTSGLPDIRHPRWTTERLEDWERRFWQRRAHPFRIAIEEVPVRREPGTAMEYSPPGYAALGYAITASLRDAPQSDIRTLLRDRIMDPLGVPPGAWSMGYGREYELDGLRLHPIWGGGRYTARAVARVAQLMLHKGNWNGVRLVDPAWVDSLVSHSDTPLPEREDGDPEPAWALGWVTNFDAIWPSVPRDAYAGAGAGNQLLVVIPSLQMAAVRFGNLLGDPDKGDTCWGGIDRYFLRPLMETVRDRR